MRPSLPIKILLIFAGLTGLIVGSGMLFMPIEFHGSSGIILPKDINLLNEMRAAGGALFASALIILAGAFSTRLTFSSLLIATSLYASYGLARLMAIAMDGMPSVNLTRITALEIVIGLLCALGLFTYACRAKFL